MPEVPLVVESILNLVVVSSVIAADLNLFYEVYDVGFVLDVRLGAAPASFWLNDCLRWG